MLYLFKAPANVSIDSSTSPAPAHQSLFFRTAFAVLLCSTCLSSHLLGCFRVPSAVKECRSVLSAGQDSKCFLICNSETSIRAPPLFIYPETTSFIMLTSTRCLFVILTVAGNNNGYLIAWIWTIGHSCLLPITAKLFRPTKYMLTTKLMLPSTGFLHFHGVLQLEEADNCPLPDITTVVGKMWTVAGPGVKNFFEKAALLSIGHSEAKELGNEETKVSIKRLSARYIFNSRATFWLLGV